MELQQILDFMGFKEAPADIEAFKAEFGKNYIGKNIAAKDPEIRSKVAGEVLGAATVLAKREFGLEGEDLKDKKLEEVLQLGLEKQKNLMDELKAAASKGDDEKVKALQDQLESVKKQAKEEADLRKSIAQQLEESQKNFTSEIKKFKVDSTLGQIESKMPWLPTSPVVEVAKEGFKSVLQKKYIFDLDEKGEAIVTDKEGNRIPNESKNDFLKPEDVIKMEADKAGLLAKSNGKPDQKQQFQAAPKDGESKVRIHPNAIAATQR